MLPSNKASLVIDGSGIAVFAGLLDAENRWLAKAERDGSPLEELFPLIEAVLTESGLSLDDIGSYIYCMGPGSVLGIRLCAMAIETWSRLYPKSVQYYKYNSLQLSAHALLYATPDLKDALIGWENLIYHLPQRKGWQSPPDKVQTLIYDPSILDAIHDAEGLLQITDRIELYSSGINTFQKWTPTRHRAQT